MKTPKVAVVILNWNGRFFLEKFLLSVYNSMYANLEIVVGDNGSTDGSVDYVRDNFPQVKIIQNRENLGYAGGYNAVLKHVDADYYALLNSDVEVSPGWIDPIIRYMEAHPNIAAAQPKIKAYHDRRLFEYAGAAGGFLDRFGFPFCRGRVMQHIEEDHGQYDDARTIFWASGAALFIRKSCWLEAGGFDGDYFAHMEEIDLCWRLQRLGYRIGYCPDAEVYHVGGGTLAPSNPTKTYLNFRNSLFTLQKNLPLAQGAIAVFCRLWIDLAAIFRFLAQGKFKDAWAVSRSHQSFFYAFFKTDQKRRQLANHTGRPKGIYRGSVAWAFFAGGKKTFNKLRARKFT